jgi:NADH-ubiquinone oxidoreductase chain 5
LAACTKRAQIPFRAWLPAAMAAPTPVSSLVHSSTLVTAGVYLIIRFENLLIYLNISKILLYLGCLTIFIARLRAFFEIDIKKIVALSTLSQLGVIITRLGAGLYMIRFFHLLTHAFFKALLFIRAGNLIHRSESYQDLRTIGGNSEILPIRTRIVIGASMRLCGLPFISAFYSKELIIERLLIYNINIFSYILIIIGVFITLFYRLRFLILAIIRFNRQRSLFNKSDKDYIVNFRIFILLLPAIIGGSFISLKIKIRCSLLIVSNLLKYIVYFLLVLSVFIYIIFYKNNIVIFNKSL